LNWRPVVSDPAPERRRSIAAKANDQIFWE
jgi:hypothetical protein